MKALAPTASFTFAVPDWLQSCLNAPLSNSEPVPERSSTDSGLICRAFELPTSCISTVNPENLISVILLLLPVYYEIWEAAVP